MDTTQRDAEAWTLHCDGKTWSAIAEQMHYANGSVARRAALRHRDRTQPTPPPSVVRPAIEQPARGRPDWQVGTLLTHTDLEGETFEFVKWNRDGSAQVWGGARGHASMRDFHIERLRVKQTDRARGAA